MSNKRIQKKIDQLFSDLAQTEDKTPQPAGKQKTTPKKAQLPASAPDLKPAAPSAGKVSSRRAPSRKGDQATGPTPQALTQTAEMESSATLLVPFQRSPDNWVALEAKSPDMDRLWSREEQTLVKQVTDQLSLALENARLFQQTQRQASELQILNEMGRELSTQLNLTGVGETVYKYVLQLMEVEVFFLCLYSEEKQLMSFPVAYSSGRPILIEDRPLANSPTDYIIKSKSPLLIPENVIETFKKMGFDYRLFDKGLEPLSWLGTPLLLGDKVLGAIVVQSTAQARLYNQSHLGLLTSIANQAAATIQNAQLFEETQKHGFEVEILNEMARALSSSLDIGEIITSTYQYASRLLDTSSFYIALYDEEENTISFPIFYEQGKRLNIPPKEFGNGLTEFLLRRGEPLLIEESTAEKIQAMGIDAVGSVSKCWLGVPMMLGNRSIGVIAIESYTDEHAFDFHARNLLTSIASQASVAIENARLFQEASKRNQELGTLNEIIGSASASLDLKELLKNVLEKVIPVAGFDGGLITMFNQKRGELERIVRTGLPGEPPPDPAEGLENSLCAAVFESKSAMVIEDLRRGAPVDVSGEIEAGFLSYLGVPLEARGQTLGTLCGFRHQAGAWGKNTLPILQTIGRQIGAAIENAYLFSQVQLRAEEMAALNDLGRALASRLSLDQVLDEVYRGVSRLLDTTNFYIAIHDAEKNENVFLLNVTESQIDGQITRLPAGKGITGYIIQNRASVLIKEDVLGWLNEHGIESVGEPAKSWLGVPILLGDQILGALAVQNYTTPYAYDEHDQYLLSAIGNQASIAIQNARLFEAEQHRREIADALSEMAKLVSATLDITQIANILLDQVAKLITYRSACIQSIKQGKRSVIGGRGIDLNATTTEGAALLWRPVAEDPLISKIVASRQPIVIPDTYQDPNWTVTTDTQHVRSWIGCPLLAGEEVLGILTLDSDKPDAYNEELGRLVSAFAAQAAIALQNARLFQDVEQRSNELALINRVVSTVALSLNIAEALQTTISEIADSIPDIGRATGTLLNAKQKELSVVAEYKKIQSPSIYGQKIPVYKNSNSAYVIENKKPYVVNNAQNAPSIPPQMQEMFRQAGIYTIAIFPVILNDEVVGTVNFDITNPVGSLIADQIRLIETVLTQVSIAIQNARLFEQIRSSENRFRDISTILGDYIWETDLEWKYTYVSGRVQAILGYTPEELLGRTDYDLYDPEEADRLSQLLIEAIDRDGRAVDIENEVIFKNGQKGYILTSAVPILDQNGKRVGYRGVDKDITERRRSEKMQQVLQTITASALAAPDMYSLLSSIHAAIKMLIPAENMYVALYDERVDLLTFPYYVDQFDKPMPPQKIGRGLTSYVLRLGTPLLVTPEVFQQLVAAGEIHSSGTPAVDWIGIPLRSRERTLGVLAIQTYSPEIRLTERDRDALATMADQISVAIERKQSELELRALFSSLTDVILVYDKEGRYIRIAPTNPSRLFLPPEDMLGKKVTEVLPAELHEPFMKVIHDTLETGQTNTIEYPLEINSRLYWFNASVSKLSEEQVFWVARDVTERRIFEETLKKQNEYLATSAEIGRLITSTLDLNTLFSRTVNLVRDRFGFYHASIFIVDETGFNASVKAATGDAGEEMLKRGHTLQVGSRSIVGTVTATGNPMVVNDTTTDPIHRPNPLLPDSRSETAIPLRIGKRIIGALDIQSTEPNAFSPDAVNVLQTLADQVAVAIDNARSYELAQQAINEMRELDRLKSQFLANMSHELRTPLNSIIGFSRVILKGIDGPISELQEQDLNAIYNSGQHLLHLINDILDLSKIDAGKMELTFDDINLGELIESIVPTAKGLIKDKPITLVQNIAPNIPIVRADATRIRQVMLNLLSNAAKFTEQGTITIEAGVEVNENSQPEIVVKVADTGPGIAPQDLSKLFQPFSQVDASPTRKTGGTGLGLSISRRLIELHGGRIGVNSETDKGSTFYFTLPLPKVAKEIKAQEIESPNVKVVLAIDDDTQVISLYERYLQPQGYQVIALTDPTKALERARELKPFAITLDIMMPGRDGWSVLTELKSHVETRDIPVIICSILEEEEKGFSLGAADYLVKPILEDDLIRALNRLNSENDIRNVLVIDDETKDLRLIQKLLSESGQFQPILCEGGKSGWAEIERQKPDAVILDLFMPDLDGFKILEKLRSSPELADIPVIVVSGADLTPEQQQQLDNFGQGLLQKGALNEQELLSRLERALKRIRQ